MLVHWYRLYIVVQNPAAAARAECGSFHDSSFTWLRTLTFSSSCCHTVYDSSSASWLSVQGVHTGSSSQVKVWQVYAVSMMYPLSCSSPSRRKVSPPRQLPWNILEQVCLAVIYLWLMTHPFWQPSLFFVLISIC